jgi:hypothetical protein
MALMSKQRSFYTHIKLQNLFNASSLLSCSNSIKIFMALHIFLSHIYTLIPNIHTTFLILCSSGISLKKKKVNDYLQHITCTSIYKFYSALAKSTAMCTSLNYIKYKLSQSKHNRLILGYFLFTF